MAEKDHMEVNDGNGLFDAEGLIDSLIVDTNETVKSIAGGNYIGWCKYHVQMVQKLAALKKGVTEEQAEREKQIEELRKENDELLQRIIGYQKEEVNGDV